jgi:predicted FMN-binding regulatory protein PaiB
MQESISENGILYPNPASDYINIKLNGISTDKLEICDITGKVLLSQTITNDYQQMQIRDLKRGMYFLKIYDKNQNIKTLKFVKR